MGFKPICRLSGLLAKCGQDGVINSILEMFPSFRCICNSQAWKGFLKCLGKFLNFSLIVSFADVNTWSSFLFRVVQSLYSQFYSATHQGSREQDYQWRIKTFLSYFCWHPPLPSSISLKLPVCSRGEYLISYSWQVHCIISFNSGGWVVIRLIIFNKLERYCGVEIEAMVLKILPRTFKPVTHTHSI